MRDTLATGLTVSTKFGPYTDCVKVLPLTLGGAGRSV